MTISSLAFLSISTEITIVLHIFNDRCDVALSGWWWCCWCCCWWCCCCWWWPGLLVAFCGRQALPGGTSGRVWRAGSIVWLEAAAGFLWQAGRRAGAGRGVQLGTNCWRGWSPCLRPWSPSEGSILQRRVYGRHGTVDVKAVQRTIT